MMTLRPIRIVQKPGVWMAILALLTACTEAGPPHPWGVGSGKNVLLIVVDSLRADHLSCYGYERATSPEIDRLASQGLLFERAYSHAPWTTPSVASLLTSQYPTVLGITSEPDRLAERFELLPEILLAEGYDTAAIVSHYFLGKEWRFDQGFEVFDESSILGHKGISSERVTGLALDYLKAPRDRPFFLFVHYFDPHYNYLEHEAFRFWNRPYEGWIEPGLAYETLVERYREIEGEHLERLISLYDSEIAFTDHHIGRLLDGLESLGHAEDTLVILTADHGEEFRDHGGLGHGGKLTDETIRVPLVIRPPRFAGPPRRETRLTGLIDLAPTILEWLAFSPPEGMRGRSLFAPVDPDRPLLHQVFSETAWSQSYSIVLDQHKLIFQGKNGTQRQLYDLENDPGEQDNLFRRPREVPRGTLEQLRRRLVSWRRVTEAEAGERDTRLLRPEEEAALKALGYLGSDRPRTE